MKIGFFLQNIKKGGLDTFVIQLIKHWPYKEDQITLYCNKSHPGLDYLNQNIVALRFATVNVIFNPMNDKYLERKTELDNLYPIVEIE